MNDNSKRLKILDMVENGKITAEDAVRLIQALGPEDDSPPEELTPVAPTASQMPAETSAPEAPPPPEAGTVPPEAPRVDAASDQTSEKVQPEILSAHQAKNAPPNFARWRRWWLLPFWVGVGITILGAGFMYMSVENSNYGFWFFCTGALFTIGLLLMIAGWQSRTARWLHLRVQQKPGERPQKIILSFPLPLRLTAWFFRTFRHRIPNLGDTNVEEIITAVGTSTSPENPLYIEVDEGEDGERVEIYIG